MYLNVGFNSEVIDMGIRLSEKPFVNIPHETDKCRINNRRYDAFIKSCIKELNTAGETICFSQKQIDEIKQHIDLTEICYDERNDCYYLFSKA